MTQDNELSKFETVPPRPAPCTVTPAPAPLRRLTAPQRRLTAPQRRSTAPAARALHTPRRQRSTIYSFAITSALKSASARGRPLPLNPSSTLSAKGAVQNERQS